VVWSSSKKLISEKRGRGGCGAKTDSGGAVRDINICPISIIKPALAHLTSSLHHSSSHILLTAERHVQLHESRVSLQSCPLYSSGLVQQLRDNSHPL
jgi:hypothetical protein